MDTIPHWFEGTHLNFAENVLFSASATDPSIRSKKYKKDSKIALTEIREGNTEVRHLAWGELRQRVGLLANALRAKGLRKGDRVAVVASTSFDTFICFMAITSIGGLFSSSSTDMGTKGILERLLQIRPVYVFVDDWAVYNGKTLDLRSKIKEMVEGMRDVSEFKGVVTQPRYPGKPADVKGLSKTVTLDSFLKAANGNSELSFERVAFRDPFLIVYSSGTTGVPKCIVHSTGGSLISIAKEGLLHRELSPNDTVLQYTTVSQHLSSAYIVLTSPDRLDHVPRLSANLPLRHSLSPLRWFAFPAIAAGIPLHPSGAESHRLRHLTALSSGAPEAQYHPKAVLRSELTTIRVYDGHGALRIAIRVVLWRHWLPTKHTTAEYLRWH